MALSLARLAASVPVGARLRLPGLDRLRGVAVALVLADHAVLAFHGPLLVRETVTRAAMPIFFLLAGQLAGRPRWRHGLLVLLGCALPLVAPWLDSPNVLLYLGVLLPVVGWVAARDRWALWLPVVVALTMAANGYDYTSGTGYQPVALLALLCAGKLLPLDRLDALGARLPGWLAWLGRHALAVYVGQALAFAALMAGVA